MERFFSFKTYCPKFDCQVTKDDCSICRFGTYNEDGKYTNCKWGESNGKDHGDY